jgi:hypothetical protein
MSFSSDIPGLQSQLPISIELPEEPKQLRLKINDLYQRIATAMNAKEGALYVPQEKVTGGQYFITSNPQKTKIVYRMVVDFGALPNTATKSVAHNIPGWDSNFRLTRSYGGSTDPVALEALPLPNEGILLMINSTDVTVTTTSNRAAFTETTIVIEYTKGT